MRHCVLVLSVFLSACVGFTIDVPISQDLTQRTAVVSVTNPIGVSGLQMRDYFCAKDFTRCTPANATAGFDGGLLVKAVEGALSGYFVGQGLGDSGDRSSSVSGITASIEAEANALSKSSATVKQRRGHRDDD